MPLPRKTIEEEISDACRLLEVTMLEKYSASKAEINQALKKRAAQHNYLLAEDMRLDILRRL